MTSFVRNSLIILLCNSLIKQTFVRAIGREFVNGDYRICAFKASFTKKAQGRGKERSMKMAAFTFPVSAVFTNNRLIDAGIPNIGGLKGKHVSHAIRSRVAGVEVLFHTKIPKVKLFN